MVRLLSTVPWTTRAGSRKGARSWGITMCSLLVVVDCGTDCGVVFTGSDVQAGDAGTEAVGTNVASI